MTKKTPPTSSSFTDEEYEIIKLNNELFHRPPSEPIVPQSTFAYLAQRIMPVYYSIGNNIQGVLSIFTRPVNENLFEDNPERAENGGFSIINFLGDLFCPRPRVFFPRNLALSNDFSSESSDDNSEDNRVNNSLVPFRNTGVVLRDPSSIYNNIDNVYAKEIELTDLSAMPKEGASIIGESKFDPSK